MKVAPLSYWNLEVIHKGGDNLLWEVLVHVRTHAGVCACALCAQSGWSHATVERMQKAAALWREQA